MSDGYRTKPVDEDERRFWDEAALRVLHGLAITTAALKEPAAHLAADWADHLLQARRQRFGAV